nr:Retrovirus-related Pol polyprotein from transposon TNT 1-94 [Cajanus cajan]
MQDPTTQRMIGLAKANQHLYLMHNPCVSHSNSICNSAFVSKTQNKNMFDLWHFRLGHPSYQVLKIVKKHSPYVEFNDNTVCDYCHLAKQSRLPFPVSNSKSFSCFELVHMDIWGPIAITSIHGHRFFLTIVNDFSRHTWTFLMKSKAETRKLIHNFVALIETRFNKRIKTIRTDNGSEFLMHDFYAQHGILHQTSCIETPQQNSVVERKHRHILNVTRSLLFHSNLPKVFWNYAVSYAVHLINRLPSPVLNNCSPFQMLYDQSHTLLDLKVFGCLCFAGTLSQN